MTFRPLLGALVIVASATATSTTMSASIAPAGEAGAMGSGVVMPRVFQGAPLASSPDALPAITPVHPRRWLEDLAADPNAGRIAPTGSPTEIGAPGDVRAFAATDATIFQATPVTGAPRNFSDEVLEPSIATNGSTVFVTFNYFDAISTDFGVTWRYFSPFSNFDPGTSAFCCDQRVVYEPTRNLFLWVLQYGDQDPGYERLAVATPANAVLNKWTTYDFRAGDLPGTSPTWMVDYPQLGFSANFLYLTLSVGPVGSPGPSATGIFRISLDQLAQGTRPLSLQIFQSSLGNTITPVQRAPTAMYFAQNVSTQSLNLYSWPETGSVLTTVISHTPTASVRGASCLTPDGKNICGRLDSRIMSGWVGGGVIGFAWSAGAGSGHAFPYAQLIRINEAARFVVEEPAIFSDVNAYVYPALSLNARGDLGAVVTAVSTNRYPSILAFMRDDVSGPTTWTPLPVKNGTAGPKANEWGDYQTVVPATQGGNSWIAMSWTIQPTGVEPLFISFGRLRDAPTPGASPTPSASPTMTPTSPPGPTPPPGSNAAATVYLPNVTKMLGGPDGWQTPFIVQNVGAVNTDLQMSFYAFADGSLVKTRNVAGLLPGTSVFHDPNSDTDLAPGGQYSVVIRSTTAAVVAVVNEHQNVTNTTRQEALSYDGLSTGSTAVLLPYVAKAAGGWLTTIIIQNLGTAPASVSAGFLPASGPAVTLTRTIDVGRSQFIDPTVEPTLAGGAEYAATLTSTQPIAVVVNAHNDAATVPAPRGFSYNAINASSVENAWLPYVARNSDGIGRSSKVYVQNAGSIAATPKLTLRRHGDATSAAVSVTGVSLQPGAVWLFDAAAATQLTDGDWSLGVQGGKFAVIGAALSPATAMGISAANASPERLFLPNVTRTLGGATGWTTPLIVQSTGAPTFTVKWYRFSDGSLITTGSYTGLLPTEAIRIDPRSITQLTDNTQYAVVVESAAGGIAASVLELNLMGGDGAMGYDGFSAPPSAAYGTSGCDPQSAVAGSNVRCIFYGFAAGASVTVTIASPTGRRILSPTEATAADGSWTLVYQTDVDGAWSASAMAGGVTKTAQFVTTPATFSVTLVSSAYGSVSVKTSAGGILCQPLIVFPSGSTTSGFFLPQKTSDATGQLSWTYATPVPGVSPGQGTSLVRCYSGSEEHDAKGTFSAF